MHSPGFPPARDEDAVRAAVARLGIEYPVLIDRELEVWRDYENQGWPARYLFDGRARLFEYHYGEGAYAETELAIQELLGVEREPLEPMRPEDAPDAQLLPRPRTRRAPTRAPTRPAACGRCWTFGDPLDLRTVVGNGTGRCRATDDASEPAVATELQVSHPGAYPWSSTSATPRACSTLEIGPGVECHATCFTPGLA